MGLPAATVLTLLGRTYNRRRLHSTNGNRPPAEYEIYMSQPRPIGEAINNYVRTLKPKELISS